MMFIEQNERTLLSLPKLNCDVCSTDIYALYDNSYEAVRLNHQLLSMAATHPQGVKLLSSGRVVILRDGVYSFRMF
jgi:antiviral helicase SKI2